MKNLIGMKWEQLEESIKEELMESARAVDGRTGNKPKKSMRCIIDFENGLSASGYIELTSEEEIISVMDESILYNPLEVTLDV